MKETVFVEGIPRPEIPLAHAVKANGFVFISGQTPRDPRSGTMPASFRDQAQKCLENVAAVLEAAGSSVDQVVKVNAYLTDLGNFAEFNEVYQGFFDSAVPARTTVGVQLNGFLIEIDCVAVVEG